MVISIKPEILVQLFKWVIIFLYFIYVSYMNINSVKIDTSLTYLSRSNRGLLRNSKQSPGRTIKTNNYLCIQTRPDKNSYMLYMANQIPQKMMVFGITFKLYSMSIRQRSRAPPWQHIALTIRYQCARVGWMFHKTQARYSCTVHWMGAVAL